MKKIIIKLVVLLSLTLSFVSCEDFLTTKSKSDLNADLVFQDPGKIEGVLFKAYFFMASNNSYRNRMLLPLDWNSDIECYSSSTNASTLTVDGSSEVAFAYYSVSSGNQRDILNTGWDYIYKAIEQTNQVIAGIDLYADKTNPKVRALYAEALTIRSYLYTDLVKWWGDVPARWEPASMDNIRIPATSRDEIYTHLLADLLTAQDYIDWAGTGNANSSVIRVNKAAVKALRARIALYAAGYSQRPLTFVSPQVAVKTGPNSQVAKGVTETREKELYEIARVETKSIIDQYGKAKLMNTFENVFKAVSKQTYAWGSTESLWEQAYRNQFLYNNMLPDGTKTRWNDKGSAGGKVCMVPSFFYDFESGDTRRDISAVPYKWSALSLPSGYVAPATDGGVTQVLESNLYKLAYAKLRPEWFASGTFVSSSNDTYGHLVVVRYADVLLMYAEACLKTNTDLADGLEKLNWVRQRAFGDTSHDKAALDMDVIMAERAFELAGERIRKYDLIRWGVMKDKMDAAIANVYHLYNKEAPYADVPLSVYTKLVTGPYTNSQVLEIWGLNRGETAVPSDPDMTGPTDLSVTSSTLANIYYLYNTNPAVVATVNNTDPELRTLLPYHNSVITGNSYLVNQYGY